MSISLRNQKIFFNKLVDILQRSDSLSIELDAELVKSKSFDKLSLILTGLSAVLSTISEQLQFEIAQHEDKERMDKEFERIFREEQERFARRKVDPPDELDEEMP